MRWKRVDSTDVIDQRAGGGFPGGGRVAIPGGLGITGILLYLAISLLGGGGGSASGVDDPFGGSTQAPGVQSPRGIPASQDPERDLKDFSVYVFERTQQVWQKTFADQGKPYEHAKLVLYRGGVNTACGSASSAVGPFYCPGDQRVYLDLSFYSDMTRQPGAKGGDFAWAYVIAHEMGHHVQHELSLARPRNNAESVKVELQADCYAGVWAHHVDTSGNLETGDVAEALDAATSVGDDRLQKRATGSIDPDSFTHRTSAERV